MTGSGHNDSADVLSQGRSLTSPSGKTGSDLISEDTKIDEQGAVTGTLKYVSEWKEFSDDPEEQKGYFFPVVLDSKYEGKEITLTGTKTKKATDLEWALLLKNGKESTFTFSTDEDGEILKLTFKDVALNSGWPPEV